MLPEGFASGIAAIRTMNAPHTPHTPHTFKEAPNKSSLLSLSPVAALDSFFSVRNHVNLKIE